MEQTLLTNDQYRELTRKIVHSIEKRCRIIPLNSLRHPKYYLKFPVYITLESEENGVLASFDEIEAFSFADTESEATDQLCEEIVQIYEDLRDDEQNLAHLPGKWLQYLKEIIECR